MSNTPSVNIIGTCPSPIWRLGSPKCDARNNSFSYLSTTPVTPLFSELRSRHRLSSLSPHSHRSARSSPTLRRRSGALQSSLSLPSSLTQKCERGLLNGPDRRWRPQCAAAGGDDFAVSQSNKSTYCTHSTARGTGRRLGSQITEKGERVRNGIPSKKGLLVLQLHKFLHAKPGMKMRRSYLRMQSFQIFGSPFHTLIPT